MRLLLVLVMFLIVLVCAQGEYRLGYNAAKKELAGQKNGHE